MRSQMLLLSFLAATLSLNPLREDGLGQEMSKRFGPLGLLAGVSYSILK